MIKKIKRLIEENRSYHRATLRKLNELEWANVYHDSIRGKKWIENLPLNIGRWAGNYPFFYFLHRILEETQPESILEFGLGESSKMINAYIDNSQSVSEYLVIEHSKDWKNQFLEKNKSNDVFDIKICELEVKKFNTEIYKSYKNLSEVIKDKKFDFYLFDGPFGSKHYSRFDLIMCFNTTIKTDKFIILLDDTHRKGEIETLDVLKSNFDDKNIEYFSRSFSGVKTFTLIVSPDYKYLLSL
jgi:hypothetical protein